MKFLLLFVAVVIIANVVPPWPLKHVPSSLPSPASHRTPYRLIQPSSDDMLLAWSTEG